MQNEKRFSLQSFDNDQQLISIGIISPVDECPGWLIEAVNRLSKLDGVRLRSIPANHQWKVGPVFRAFKWLTGKLLPGHAGLLGTGRLPSIPTAAPGEAIDFLIDPGYSAIAKTLTAADHTLIWKIGSLPVAHPLAGLREWCAGEEVTYTTLSGGALDTIHSACTRTFPLSYPKNMSRVYVRAINTLVDGITALASNQKKTGNTGPENGSAGQFENETILAGMAFMVLALRLVNKVFLRLMTDERWVLKIGTKKAFDQEGPQGMQFLMPPGKWFWADPFLATQDDRTFLFVEECPSLDGKGHLSCIEIEGGDSTPRATVILDKPYHLSYPNVFRYRDNWYMIPESSANRTIDLYEAEEFPYRWKFRKTLRSEISAFDSTLLFTQDKVWLFCNVNRHEAGTPEDDLFIFHTSELLEGEWTPHRANPVKSDPYTSRPAGAFLMENGQIIRPSQVGVPRYGHAIALNRVIELNEQVYREETIRLVRPGQGLLATHTLNVSGDQAVVDVIRDTNPFSAKR